MTRPFRFGVQATGATSRAEWVALARKVEQLGYATLTMPDHFGEQLAPVPALMCAADATSTLRVGALVFGNDFRHPVVLAKELATLDLLSDGRLEIGLGAGWERTDYDQSGIALEAPGQRIERLTEAVAIVRRLLSGETVDHNGPNYRLSQHHCTPAAVQQPCPPILIGGGGPRMLRMAAANADIVGINGTLTAGTVGTEALMSMAADAVDTKVAIVREAAGDRFGDLELNMRTFLVQVTDDRTRATADIAAFVGLPPEAVAASPFALIGTPDQMADDLLARRERWGLSYFVVGAAECEAFAPVVAALAGR